MFSVTIVATGAGVHGGNEHKVGRVADMMTETTQLNTVIFEWLTKSFEAVAWKFW